MSQENVEIVRRVHDSLARRDTRTVRALYDPEIEMVFSHSPFADFMQHSSLRRTFASLLVALGRGAPSSRRTGACRPHWTAQRARSIGSVRIGWSAAVLGVLAFLALVVNGLGAIAQERNGGVGEGFPEWLYTASGYSFYVSVLGRVVLAVVAVLGEMRGRR